MEHYFAPAGASLPDIPEASRVLVLAPHADDEVFGCGGLLARLADGGSDIRVVVFTQPDETALAEQRQRESCQAAEQLGYPPPTFWGLADSDLANVTDLTERTLGLLEEATFDLVLAPSPWEMHRDHRALGEAALEACQQATFTGVLGFYEVGQPLQPNMLVDITPVLARKSEAMRAFGSQQTLQDYYRHIQALNVYRTYSLPREVEAAEALLLLKAEELADFEAHMTPQRLSASVWQAEREVAKFRAEQARLTQDLVTVQEDARHVFQEKQQLASQLATSQGELDQLRHGSAGLLEENEQLTDLREAQAQTQRLHDELQAMRYSHSWKITRPLRLVTQGLREPDRIPAYLKRRAPPSLRSTWHDVRNPSLLARKVLHRLPPHLQRPLRSLHQRLLRTARTMGVSTANQASLQAMGERRMAELDALGSGWVARTQQQPSAWPEIAVSVVTYNSERWLTPLMESLLRQAYPLERLHVVFIDNGSQDGTVEMIERFQQQHGQDFAGISLHRRPNLGFGNAHNWAAAHSQGDYLLVTNPDLEFDPQAIVRVVSMAEQDCAEVASWELRQRPYEHPKHYDPVSWETHWSSHACILIRRETFDTLGGYDQRIFLYGEDVEFSFRCREAGYRLRYCPVAMVLHHTYEQANQVKPSQYLGSTRANLFLRLRYGNQHDQLAGGLMALAGLLRGPFPGARRRLLREYLGLLRQAPQLMLENRRRGGHRAGIFRGFDYEMTRHGAFVPVPTLPATPPLVSVITRTYQGRDWLLTQAGLSVLQQTYPNLEWIVVEDGGEYCRATVDTLAASAPCVVRYASQEKYGRSAAGNLGLSMAQGRWCMFLDDDDLLYADHIETLAHALMANDQLSAAYALSWDVSCDVDPANRRFDEVAYTQQVTHIQEFDTVELSVRNYIPIQAILFERGLFTERDGFREHFDYLEDWNLWRRYAHGRQFELIRKTTSLFRTPAHEELSAQRQALLDKAYRDTKAETDAELETMNKYLHASQN